ncbi:hypothetical protein [Leptospira kmetyi]|uniref:Uncharacterized protein n=1 Tax=Leptospira kmetyi TaxID=408139 RepID=A0A2M9XNT8_9LEPT|nr:hypothetical protein [Leptospira kmetyi]AYV55783.1 hypothetical protein EFP84_09850 [Leptospira kmetyi]EQA52501.1 hypothetical protein LEP1GSC052_3348 [Leptospira kmetyi serovar Malaysia str. Bejo-Iso9]PJZ30481.1 hypothetical protein CH378_07540 [Leptospira kmetyi]PJZ40886.1 hypothetical protein CH370_14135 [Leptospira kmetyi]TGK16413.1 hypothetical protein EHO62_11780 [Leptospira kmetyi]
MDSGSEMNQKNELLLSLLNGEEANATTDIKLQNQLIQMEESIQAGINAATLSYLDQASHKGKFSDFQEAIDLQKADLSGYLSKDVPEYLRRYVTLELARKSPSKESIVVKLGKSGARIFDSLVESLQINTRVDYAPSMRSALTKDPSEFVVFEEKVLDNSKFTYQLVQETPETAFLSVKIESPDANSFQRVNLYKDTRFILSNQFNNEGIANFSGLREGKYTVEFQGKENSKSLDLFILLEA